MHNAFVRASIAGLVFAVATAGWAAGAIVGPAPAGDAAIVAEAAIKESWPDCKKVVGAKRRPDGAILAKCDGVHYLIHTMFVPTEGRMETFALNCKVAREKLNIKC